MTYDSTQDTRNHINRVRELMIQVISLLIPRMINHDASKLDPPEKEIFDIYTPKLSEVTYGSNEYRKYLSEMKIAIDHHQKSNRHHPEHFENGIHGMNLIDLVEMVCDWKAASERHNNGNIYRSLEINRERFNMSDQLYSILVNTIKVLNGEE